MVDAHETPLLRYVLHLLGCELPLAEDVVQDAFLRLHRQVVQHGPASIADVSCWLYKVTHNLAIDAVRKKRRQRKLMLRLTKREPEAALPRAGAGDESDPLGQLQQQEMQRAAMEQLRALPAEQRQLLLLKVIQGMTLRQISQVTGLSPGNAGYRVNKALAELARRLKEKGVV